MSADHTDGSDANQQPLPRLRPYLTAVVALAELAHLAWEHFHGGVHAHHILNRTDLPAISNGWGLLLLPALTWFLTGRMQKRIALHPGGTDAASKLPVSVVAGFFGAMLFGMLMAGSFTSGHETITGYLFQGMLLLALLLPVYRAECVLGFVLGMTFTFGAVLPTAVGVIVAALSAIIHLGVRPVVVLLWTRLRAAPP